MTCGEDLVGRAGRKFCSDQCRATYHNRVRKDLLGEFSRMQIRFIANLRALPGLHWKKGEWKSLPELLRSGLDPRYCAEWEWSNDHLLVHIGTHWLATADGFDFVRVDGPVLPSYAQKISEEHPLGNWKKTRS